MSERAKRPSRTSTERNGHNHTRHLTNPVESGVKIGGSWFYEYKPGNGPRNHSSQSKARALAAAMIAKIPFDLSSHVARCFQPGRPARATAEMAMVGTA